MTYWCILQFIPSDGRVCSRNQASLFNPSLGCHLCRVSAELGNQTWPDLFLLSCQVWARSGHVDNSPVMLVLAARIRLVYLAQFWAVIHAESQLSWATRHSLSYFFRQAKFGPVLGQIILATCVVNETASYLPYQRWNDSDKSVVPR